MKFAQSVQQIVFKEYVDTVKVLSKRVGALDEQLEAAASAPQLMAYPGLVPSEHSSSASKTRGGITKTGNRHVRRVLVEAAWSCRPPPDESVVMR